MSKLSIYSVCVGLLISISFNYTLDARIIHQSRRPTYAGLRTDDAIAQHAMNTIKNELSKKTGSPFRVSCTYRLAQSRPVSATTKIYYIDYHKDADAFERSFVTRNNKIDRIVEVVYKPSEKNYISLVEKDINKKNRRLNAKRVKISQVI